VMSFSMEMHQLLESIIDIHDTFNLPQFLQGENLPYHVEALDAKMKLEGEMPFKCYLVALVAMMCGLVGTRTMKGSIFMDNNNGRTVLLGIQCLRQVGIVSPHSIYWGYVSMRALHLGYPTDQPHHFVVARIACLTRATVNDIETLQEAWETLTYAEQSILVKTFLADGIIHRAQLLTMLPLFFERAKSNPVVGLALALEVLVSLVDLLNRESRMLNVQSLVWEVNLSDVAAFTGEVRCPHVFRQVPQQVLFPQSDDSVRVLVSGDLWCQVRKVSQRREYDLQAVAYTLCKLERETIAIQRVLGKVIENESAQDNNQGSQQRSGEDHAIAGRCGLRTERTKCAQCSI